MKRSKTLITIFTGICLLGTVGFGQTYQKAPKDIQKVLDAPAFPLTSVSPAKDRLALFEPVTYPPIADLAEPMLRLAGLRINPAANSAADQRYFVNLKILNISDGKQIQVNLPDGAKMISPQWSADGKFIAAGNLTSSGVELWIIEASTGKTRKIDDVLVNTAYGGFDWMPDQKSLIVHTITKNRGAAPKSTEVPDSPSIQETAGKAAAIRTYQDLLKSPADEAQFEYYATSQLAVVGLDGEIRNIGGPGIYDTAEPSPNGDYFLTARIKKPYSYLFPVYMFGRDVEVWDRSGKLIKTIADIPLQDSQPEGGVQTGPRSYSWIPVEDASLMWVEALDDGDPRKEVKHRDKIVILRAPFTASNMDLLKIEHRYSGRAFAEDTGYMWFYDYDRNAQRRRIFETRYATGAEPKLISDLNIRDRYNDIGRPEMKVLPNGKSVIMKQSTGVILTGPGATPKGDRPFMSILREDNGTISELFRSPEDKYESVVAVLSAGPEITYITRRESITEPPNLFIKQVCDPRAQCRLAPERQLTDFKDPTPELRGIKKQLVKYKRKDGVDLSFTLYLPPDYKEGTKLPALLWAYPLEYTDTSTAGQVSGSTNRFTTLGGYSHLFLLTQGYAILDDATVPIVGDPLTVNNTFIEQLVDGAQAAVDKAVEMGVVDRDRIAAGGHSYGAFMTAHLLANSDIFRAGIARSGAYNRTLTPFGFQSERRSFWEAPEIYFKLSPFMKADKINEPVLMIHGQADNNSGTFPMQSERMYAAIQGNGGTARLVMLPFESHGYRARESVEHVLWEQIQWMDKYVKNAGPRSQ